MLLSFVLLHSSLALAMPFKRDSFNSTIKDSTFLIAMVVTLIGLIFLTTPILAYSIYRLRKSASKQKTHPESFAPMKDPSFTSPPMNHYNPPIETLKSPPTLKLPDSPFQLQRAKLEVGGQYSIDKAYIAEEFDEMTVTEFTMVEIAKIYDDGWVLAINLETGNKGVIPSDCIQLS